MKKILAGLTVMVLSLSVMAQEQTQEKKEWKQGEKSEWKNREHGPMKDMLEKLNLTEAQKAQVKTINEDFKKQSDEIKSQGLADDAMKEKHIALMKDRKEKIASVLTEEQKKQLENMKAERGDRKEMGGGKSGDRKEKMEEKLENLAKKLNLTPEQTTKFNTLRASQEKRINDINSNATLSDEQKMEAKKEARKNFKTSMGQILTPDQRKQMKELHKKNHEGEPSK